ncbi:MAG: hypothetical protein HC872_05225 [Gammaproteobacteria bacterium]|nr:hypothetical protein [Gammaproteobacteria bacterium]
MKRIAALATCLTLSGCVLSHHSRLSDRGHEFSPEALAEVRLGETDRRWVLDHLGNPDRMYADSNGVIYEYVGKTIRKSDTDFILLFSWQTERVIEEVVTRIVMRNDIVQSIEVRETE